MDLSRRTPCTIAWMRVILFGLVGLVMIAMAVWCLWEGTDSEIRWRSSQSWVPVQAELLSVKLLSHSTGHFGTTINEDGPDPTWSFANARYRYEYGGSNYESESVAIDSDDSLQEGVGKELATAYKSHERVNVYVDPHRPADAIYDRKLGFGSQAWQFGQGVFFGCMGIVLLGVAFATLSISFWAVVVFCCAFPVSFDILLLLHQPHIRPGGYLVLYCVNFVGLAGSLMAGKRLRSAQPSPTIPL
jgi:uncharacterized protein DUF3592